MRRPGAAWLAALLLGAACRTGADGDPWATEGTGSEELTSAEGERRDDAETSEDEDDRDVDTDDSANTTPRDEASRPEPEDSESTEESAVDQREPTLPRDDDTASEPNESEIASSDSTSGDSESTESESTENDAPTSTGELDPDISASSGEMNPEGISEPTEGAPPCVANQELCDGVDNTCDGLIDEAYVCPPDPGVAFGVPFRGGVYLVGSWLPGSLGTTAVQGIWPTLQEGYYEGFGDFAHDFGARRSDGQLFFTDAEALTGLSDGAVSAPPCDGYRMRWGFDVEDTLYYECAGELMRAGEVLTTGVEGWIGVTDDARVPMLHEAQGLGHWEEGLGFVPSELSISGSLELLGSSVQDDVAVAAFARSGYPDEVMVLAFDETSTWAVMRRLAARPSMHNGSWLPLVDGTVLSGQRDPVDSNETQIMMFAPDGSEQVIWSTRDATGIDAYAGDPLFAGPLEPAALDGP